LTLIYGRKGPKRTPSDLSFIKPHLQVWYWTGESAASEGIYDARGRLAHRGRKETNGQFFHENGAEVSTGKLGLSSKPIR